MRIVFGVVLAHCPLYSAGHTMAILQWLDALRSTADVWLIEEMASSELVYDEEEELSRNERLWNDFVTAFVPDGRASLVIDGEAANEADFREFAEGADLFVNYSGQWQRMEWVQKCRNRLYLDVDPGYTQIWSEGYGCDMNFNGHTHFATVGLGLAHPSSAIPSGGKNWIATPPPAAPRVWNPWIRHFAGKQVGTGAWSTVTHWHGYGEIEWQGLVLGDKRASFLELRDVPRSVPGIRFEIATDVCADWDDYGPFSRGGWTFIDNREVCATLESYTAFILSSRGEIGVAKKGYVSMKSGWMSDRTMGYLACGKPVLLQNTGWAGHVPYGDGLLPFHDAESLAAGLHVIESDYEHHSKMARELAETIFAGDKVIKRLLTML